mmetsp:Transcript_144597/g.262930  ORF Transcript_144597/g.262930 Transcript_144597/m.262930 type:complete len:470 (-) Transcript_144597:105-1514(-)
MGNGAALASGMVQPAGANPTLDIDRLSCSKPSAAPKAQRSPKAKRSARRLGRWGLRRSSRSPRDCPKDCTKSSSKWLRPLRRKASKAESVALRTIRHVSRFSDLYTLGCEVAKLSRHGTFIRHAVRCSDGCKVVVKVRERFCDDSGLVNGSFESLEEETEWRSTMERYLNLPHHDSIARCHEVLEDDKRYYVVMDRAMGEDIYEVLHREGELYPVEVREVLRQILSAVAALHTQGCIHKDLKLENVVLERVHGAEFRVKLIDFDTLTAWAPKGPPEQDVLGTDQYIAPEAYQGVYSPASDMFAIGVLAYRLLTSDFPFDNEIFDDEPGDNWVGAPQMEAICKTLRQVDISWDYKVFQKDPGALEFCQKALAMDPARRPTALQALAHPWLKPAKSSSCRVNVRMNPASLMEAFAKPPEPPAPEMPVNFRLNAVAPPTSESPSVMLLPGCVYDESESFDSVTAGSSRATIS